MRIVIDTDLSPNFIRITNYGTSERSLLGVALEIKRVLMNLASKLHYERRDFELIGCVNQEPAIRRWEWVATANCEERRLLRRDEIAEIEIRTTLPPEELLLPSKCLQCIMENEDDEEDAPGFAIHAGDPRLKVPG